MSDPSRQLFGMESLLNELARVQTVRERSFDGAGVLTGCSGLAASRARLDAQRLAFVPERALTLALAFDLASRDARRR